MDEHALNMMKIWIQLCQLRQNYTLTAAKREKIHGLKD